MSTENTMSDTPIENFVSDNEGGEELAQELKDIGVDTAIDLLNLERKQKVRMKVSIEEIERLQTIVISKLNENEINDYYLQIESVKRDIAMKKEIESVDVSSALTRKEEAAQKANALEEKFSAEYVSELKNWPGEFVITDQGAQEPKKGGGKRRKKYSKKKKKSKRKGRSKFKRKRSKTRRRR